jgi:hypothetical protein
MCTTRHRASGSLQARLGNRSQTCFHAKQAARSRHASCANLPLSVLWRNRQTESRLVLRPKQRNRRGDFEAQITKPELPVLRPKSENPPPPWFWGSTKKLTTDFEVKPGDTIATSFEAKLKKTVAAGFQAKLLETITTGFESKSAKTIQVVLRPNHSQTVDLGFKAQPRNTRSSSPRARCRPHTAPPDLSIAQPPSTWPVRPSPVLCTRSPTPATFLVTARHAALATCTPWDKQTWFSKRNKDKRKMKRNYPGFEFNPRHVNDSSQSNQGTNNLVSQK